MEKKGTLEVCGGSFFVYARELDETSHLSEELLVLRARGRVGTSQSGRRRSCPFTRGDTARVERTSVCRGQRARRPPSSVQAPSVRRASYN